MKEQLKKAKAIIEGYDGPAVRVMEVCGTHTHEIFHLGVRKILPPQVELISGPGRRLPALRHTRQSQTDGQ